MIELQDLSAIGFGTYRVSTQVREHYRALVHALQLGCNLVDTASTYGYGKSERLIGNVLRDHPNFTPFLITKAGYVTDDTQRVVQKILRAGGGADVDTMPQGWQHTIHPDFLGAQLAASLRRLNRQSVDGFLLHNPEYYYSSLTPHLEPEYFYRRIGRAFAFLEEQVAKGVIRYYGVSSNAFPLATSLARATNLRRLLAAAEAVSSTHHFRLIQFPFNLHEDGAAQPGQEGHSLLALARAHHLVTFGNRPLNARAATGAVRLASYEREVAALDPDRDGRVVARSVQRISDRLRAIGADPDPASYTVLDFLLRSWQHLPEPAAADALFQDHLLPLLELVYEGGAVPAADQRLLRQVKKILAAHACQQLQERHLLHRAELVAAGRLRADDARPVAVSACEHYLQAGLDHVLVGMRKRSYVDTMRVLF